MTRHSILFSVSMLLAAPAFAQNINIQAGPGGVSMQADLPADEPGHGDAHHGERGHHGRHGPGQPGVVSQTIQTDGYRLAFETNPGGATVMKVLAPEGAQCQVWDGRRLIAEDDLPMSFPARPDKFYRIMVRLPDGQVWEKKLSAKRGQTGSLWVEAPMPPVQVQTQVVVHEVHSEPPPPPPPAVVVPAGPMPMYESDFAALKGAIKHEDFSKDQLSVLETAVAAPSAWFTVAQVGQLVDLFDFGNDKVRAVELVVGRILDRQNAYQLYSHFDFQSEKDQVKRLLGQ